MEGGGGRGGGLRKEGKGGKGREEKGGNICQSKIYKVWVRKSNSNPHFIFTT